MGIVLGSRTPVKINEHRGRLPDFFFISQSRIGTVQQKAVYGTPDLIIELVSPSDRPSNLIALETDYCGIGVAEIVFLDQHKRRIRVIRKRENAYEEEVLTEGSLRLETLNIRLETEWLFTEPRPDELETLQTLLDA